MSPAPVVPGVVLVVGLGLIGGSLAAGLRGSAFAAEIRGFDRDPGARSEALARGLIDAVACTLEEAAAGVALVVVAVPTLSVESVLSELRVHAPVDAVITDVASVKGSVIDAARRIYRELPSGFVPGHPIAGAERSGAGAAQPDLFRAHRVILTPHETTSIAAVALVRNMWEQVGAEVTTMDAAEHDRILALTSHLPHLLAFTLVNLLSREDASEQIFRFAAGGFRDFTRIASSDPVMWRDIALANRAALLDAIDLFDRGLAGLRSAVDSADSSALHADFAAARGARGRYLEMLAAGPVTPSETSGEAV